MTFTLESLLPKHPAPLPFVGIRGGELIGHRVWEVHKLDDVPTLRSWVYPYFWLPGDFIASDIGHDVPGWIGIGVSDYNERGIWAFATAKQRDADFVQYLSYGHVLVLGSVYMFGTVIEHERGYRSQYARIRSIDAFDGHDDDLAFLRKRYGVGASDEHS